MDLEDGEIESFLVAVGFWSQWEERDTQRGPLSPAKPLPHLEY
jgi:hypothetical protein